MWDKGFNWYLKKNAIIKIIPLGVKDLTYHQ